MSTASSSIHPISFVSQSQITGPVAAPRGTSGNPIHYLLSIAVLGDLRGSPEAASYSTDVGKWIERFDDFVRGILGFESGNNLFLAVGRTIAFLGDAAIEAKSEQLALCELGRKLGYMSSVRINVSAAAADIQDYRELIAGPAISTIMLDARDGLNDLPLDTLHRLVLLVIEAGKALSLIGSPLYWLDSGVLGLQEMNGTTFNMSFTNEQRARTEIVSLVDPCASRFQIFVSASGEIYPCQGLIGIPTASIGHILVPPEESFSIVDWFRLDHWARNGPMLSTGSSESTMNALPYICRSHRESYLASR